MLAATRMDLIDGPYATLARLDRFDRRLTAHLQGLRLSGDEGRAMCEAALETPFPGVMFPLVVLALEDRDDALLARLFALTQALPQTTAGLLSGFGWVERSRLQGTVARLLRDREEFNRMIGVAACTMHGVDPGIGTGRLLQDAAPLVRARAFRATGELGLANLLGSCTDGIKDPDEHCRLWAAWSAVLLGDRGAAHDVMALHAFRPGPHRERAFRLALQAMPLEATHAALRRLAADEDNLRWVIQGSGIAGDPAYVPWLIKQMDDVKLARVAAEAFTFISGLDLGDEALDRPAPEGFEAGPTDDPDDPDVDTDPDDGLTWPDAGEIFGWWEKNGKRFQPGTRYFMGAPVSRAHCIDVLKNGYQRQRILAAHYLCLLDPGTPLFNTSAPAWRQQKLLAQMS